jgi:3-hydroxyacyl-[acyl-carrier-protein] dehydratase
MRTNALDSLPHQPPFRFIDELLELEPGVRATGLWRVSESDDFFRGHFPQRPIVPGVLIAEALAQLAGVVAFSENGRSDARPALLAQINVKFQRGISPPAEIHLEAMLAREMSGLFLFDVRATVSGEPAASGTLVLAAASLDSGKGRPS